jgi:hypothetical protein
MNINEYNKKIQKSVSYITQHIITQHILVTRGPLLHVSNLEEHAVLVGLLEFFLGGLLGKCERVHDIQTIEPDEPSNFSLDGVSELVAE